MQQKKGQNHWVTRSIICDGDDGAVLLAYVTPEHRFRGVTRTLLDQMEQHAKAPHADRMSLTTTDTARAFFEARGYSPEEEIGDLFSDDQSTLLKEWPKG